MLAEPQITHDTFDISAILIVMPNSFLEILQSALVQKVICCCICSIFNVKRVLSSITVPVDSMAHPGFGDKLKRANSSFLRPINLVRIPM